MCPFETWGLWVMDARIRELSIEGWTVKHNYKALSSKAIRSLDKNGTIHEQSHSNQQKYTTTAIRFPSNTLHNDRNLFEWGDYNRQLHGRNPNYNFDLVMNRSKIWLVKTLTTTSIDLIRETLTNNFDRLMERSKLFDKEQHTSHPDRAKFFPTHWSTLKSPTILH